MLAIFCFKIIPHVSQDVAHPGHWNSPENKAALQNGERGIVHSAENDEKKHQPRKLM